MSRGETAGVRRERQRGSMPRPRTNVVIPADLEVNGYIEW